jgi:flagellar biosynthesis protein FlhG
VSVHEALPQAQQIPASVAGLRHDRVMAVTSGSGGVGKKFLVANLAAALVRRGERVLVLDADLGLANLDVVLGIVPASTLREVFTGAAGLEETVMLAPGGFSVMLAGAGLIEASRLAPAVRAQLVGAIETLAPRYDRILLHTGAGVSDLAQHAVSLASEVLVVVSVEPNAMTEAYAAIKMLAQQQHTLLRLIVNQTGQPGEGAAVSRQLQRVVDRFVTTADGAPVALDFLGEVPADPAVRDAMRRRRLLLEAFPDAPAARAVRAIAQRLAP